MQVFKTFQHGILTISNMGVTSKILQRLDFTTNLLLSLLVKEVWKSVNIWQS